MNRHIYSFLLGCLLCVAYSARGQSIPEKDADLKIKAEQWRQEAKNGFTENKGQIHDQNGKVNHTVKYLLNMRGLNVQLRANGFSYDTWISEGTQAQQGSTDQSAAALSALGEKTRDQKFGFHRVDITLDGANPNPEIITQNAQEAMTNVIAPGLQVNDIQSYEKITYKDIYPGIDLEFIARRGIDKPVEYNFIVHPGADASRIRLQYEGANNIALKDGQLEMDLAFGKLKEKIPASYIEKTGQSIAVQYKADEHTNGLYAFNIPDYDRSKTLIIDPTPQLIWGTYFGGVEDVGLNDLLNAVKVDRLGNVIVAGYGSAVNGIATSGAYQQTYIATTNMGYIAKFTAAGVKTWGTYVGGASNQGLRTVDLDTNNNIYAGLWTNNAGLPTVGTALQTTKADGATDYDAYVIRLTPAGAFSWGTYVGVPGGGGNVVLDELKILRDGNVMISGYSAAYSNKLGFGSGISQAYHGGANDGFLVKLNGSTAAGIWGTMTGGTGSEEVITFAEDASGNIYTLQQTESAGLATAGAIQTTIGGDLDWAITKYNSTGSTISWSTYYGGVGQDAARSIIVDNNGDLVVSGNTVNTGLATAGTYHQTMLGASDGLILKMTTSGTKLWSTYVGGNVGDLLFGVKTDENNNYLYYGYTSSTTNVATNCTYQPTYGGGTWDMILGKINPSGTAMLWAT